MLRIGSWEVSVRQSTRETHNLCLSNT